MKSITVTAIKKESQAERLGIKVGDVIVSYGGAELSSKSDFEHSIENARLQNLESICVIVRRDSKCLVFKVSAAALGIKYSVTPIEDDPKSDAKPKSSNESGDKFPQSNVKPKYVEYLTISRSDMYVYIVIFAIFVGVARWIYPGEEAGGKLDNKGYVNRQPSPSKPEHENYDAKYGGLSKKELPAQAGIGSSDDAALSASDDLGTWRRSSFSDQMSLCTSMAIKLKKPGLSALDLHICISETAGDGGLDSFKIADIAASCAILM